MPSDEYNYDKSIVQHRAWITPDQFEKLIEFAQKPSKLDRHDRENPSVGWTHINLRDELLMQYMYDMGLRVGEVVQLKTNHLRYDQSGDTDLFLPGPIQKAPGADEMKPPARMEFHLPSTEQKTRIYLNQRWKDSEYLFPSQQSPKLSPSNADKRVKKYAKDANIHPYSIDGEQHPPDYVSTHTFRHSVAYRMLEIEDGYEIYDVMKRLRHENIDTTINIYNHFLTR